MLSTSKGMERVPFLCRDHMSVYFLLKKCLLKVVSTKDSTIHESDTATISLSDLQPQKFSSWKNRNQCLTKNVNTSETSLECFKLEFLRDKLHC